MARGLSNSKLPLRVRSNLRPIVCPADCLSVATPSEASPDLLCADAAKKVMDLHHKFSNSILPNCLGTTNSSISYPT